MASNSVLAGEESNSTKSSTQAGLYQELQIILEILPIDDELQKSLQSVFVELDKLSDTDSEELRSSIVSFVSLLPSLKKNDLNVAVGVQLFQNASSIFQQLSTVHPVFSVLYFVIVAGMALFNRQTNGPNLETTLREMLKEQSDNEMLNECEGIKCTLTKYAKLVCAMGDKKLETHEVSAVCAMVPIGDGFATMGKLAKRIKELRDEEYEKYCSYRTSEFEKIVRYIHVYCCLDTMKRGILWHIYALLKFSNNSPSLIKGVKAVIEEQQEENKELLNFLVRPSRETAIIHYSGNLFEHKIIRQFLEEHKMKMDDLNFLCEGVYHIKPVMYKNSKMYMAKNKLPGLKFVRWTYTKSVAQKKTRFTFKRASIVGNYFHINSHRHTEYHVRALSNGMWVEGLSGDPSAGNGTWKIIPIDNEHDEEKSKCYLIAPQGFTNMFLFAGFTGRICVQKFVKSEYEQVLWEIEQTVEDENSDITTFKDKNDNNKQAGDQEKDDKQTDDQENDNKHADDEEKGNNKQAGDQEKDDKQTDDQEKDNTHADDEENGNNKQAGDQEKDDKQTDDQENDNTHADDEENGNNKQAGDQEKDDKQTDNQENDNTHADDEESRNNKQAGDQEKDDKQTDDQENNNTHADDEENGNNKQAGDQEKDDKQAHDHENGDKQFDDQENKDSKQAVDDESNDNRQVDVHVKDGKQVDDDNKQVDNHEKDDKQADDQENKDNKQAGDDESNGNKQVDDRDYQNVHNKQAGENDHDLNEGDNNYGNKHVDVYGNDDKQANDMKKNDNKQTDDHKSDANKRAGDNDKELEDNDK
ncbi:uncharacterized protein LOC143080597 [Mytilus galloprovincialis]|uniref:uncharacterized protein LOC143080597 n=1 Tax=Mytilus galloprovincialis TaxID=29158 RepID=UPI003F7BE000